MDELVYAGRLCPSTPEAMSGTIEPPELVEDPGQPQESSEKEDRAGEEGAHGPQEAGPAYNDTDGTDDDLEIYFAEEMDAMDSSDNGSDDSDDSMDGGIEETLLYTNDREEHETTCYDKCLSENANATLEWAQFMTSTNGILQHMEEATATIQDVSSLLVISLGQEQITQHSTSGDVNDQEKGCSPPGALFSPSSETTPFESTTLPAEVPPRFSCINTMNPADMTERSADAPLSDQFGPTTAELLAPYDSIRRDSSVLDRPDSMECPASMAKQADVNETHRMIGFADTPAQNSLLAESSPPPVSSGSPGRHAGLEPTPDKQSSATPPTTISATGLLTSTLPDQSMAGEASVQNAPFSLVRKEEINVLDKIGSEPELPLASRVFKTSRVSSSQQKVALSDQTNIEFACSEGGIPVIADAISKIDVMASVGETEVARRIERDKARRVEARQQRRKDSITKARRQGSLVAFQAAWRGRRARTKAAPALATRRRESEETSKMFEEERLAERVVAFEAERREAEKSLQIKELDDMRCEETRTRKAWLFLKHLEETARGEELVRMRAEERFTRALLELELQDLRRLERVHREAEEMIRMGSEDQAMRDFKRLEEAQMAEREAMGAEDALARMWKNTEECQLDFSRAEGSRMAAEDRFSSAWNAEYRRLREGRLRQAWARSTPIQRAMDPIGVAAAQALVCSSPTVFNRRDSLVAGTGAGTESKPSISFDGKRPLMLERARRRECCKMHLKGISSCALRVRSRQQAAAKGLDKAFEGCGRNRDARDVSREGAPLREGQLSPKQERGRPVERDGEECELTVDTLSHLGPLQDLTALELCVEGLTSARLLKACTSLKSLSLNVNRLSSPAGLVVSTSLVRLGLRDNRLSSLQGLSGLPSLRELRLDINHLTSLHELKQLPALVELSANTNHIRELPEEFAAGLMSRQHPAPDKTKSRSISVEKTGACGGLQKLELYHNRIASVHPRALQGLASLTHLDLGRNQLKTLDGEALESCPALSTLVLSQNLLQEPPSPLCLPLLSEFWLSGNQISSMAAWASCQMQAEARPCLKCHHPCAILKGVPTGVAGDSMEEGLGASPGRQGAKCSEFSGTGPEGQGRVTKTGHATEREGRDNAWTGRESGNDTDEVGVWLPSLEVLHLQDNALESLGGRSTFVGCPLLRSFDASFNQLRTPNEIGISLQACTELEEVRLHDNPASSCHNYTDAVALSCPNLTRMDGVQVDVQVHWRAGANTYGARADVVLPFLLCTNESSEIHGKNERTGNSASESKASNAIEVDESCLWCGAGMPSNKIASADANDSIGGAPIVGTGGEAGEVDETSHGGGLSRPTRCRVGNDRLSQQRKCVSCGFSPPDVNVWSVPDSQPAGHFPFSWKDVCSAGDRWRGEFRLGAGFHDAPEVNHEEEQDNVSVFRTACLRGRDERASMRRRHRREERDLAARADLNEAEPRSMNLGGDSTSRLATTAPSRRRLEVELELGKRQAEERMDQAARHLSFHGGGVDVSGTDRTNGVAHESKRASDLRHTERNHVRQSPEHRRSWAARVIQHHCCRRQQLAAPSRPSLEDGTTRPAKEQAVMTLQSAFRGFHVRRGLQAALDSARYVDDEVDGLLNVNGGARFELDRFLSPPPELTDGWWWDSSTTTAPRPTKDVSRHPTRPSAARAAVSATGHLSNAREDHAAETRVTDFGSPRFGRSSEAHVIVTSTLEAGESFNDEDTSMKTTDNVLAEGGGGIGSTKANEKGLARAWGLKDPCVARAMIKRAKRMRRFQNGEARREKMKNPDVRFDVFAKNAGEQRIVRGAALTEPGCASAGSSRSDHGGRISAHRYRGGEGARIHRSRAQALSPRLAHVVDAWATGEIRDGAVATVKRATPQSTMKEGRSPLKPPNRSQPGGKVVSHKTRGGRRHAALLSAHNLGEEVLLESRPRLAGGERRAGVG